jgi:N-acetylmuramoyl-L-alanine amidase
MNAACDLMAGPWRWICLAFLCFQAVIPSLLEGYSRSQYQKFQAGLMDHRSRLNPKFQKKVRQKTRNIIVHTSELGLDATLRVVSGGKQFKSGYKTPGGHAHYVIARNGDTYKILNKQYRADHAGLSMWNGRDDVSDFSLGIELVGYHTAPITNRQYISIEILLEILQKVYGLDDRSVLTHSQIAYGKPNPWFPKNHRGRKRCAKNFNRAKAGLVSGWKYDPDVRAKRLMADPELVGVFYGSPSKGPVPVKDPEKYGSNYISRTNSAWSIAGGDYDDKTTVYLLPDGRTLPGNRISSTIGWDRLPINTKVLLNQEVAAIIQIQAQTPVKIISDSMTAWSHAGLAYREDSTIYFLPSGRVYPGSKISDWDDLPPGTRILVGYKGPYSITRFRTAYQIAGSKYRASKTIYYLPPKTLRPGDKIPDFSNLPKGAKIYLPLPSH